MGESKGYAISEGTELEVMNSLQQYVPFVIKALTGKGYKILNITCFE